MIEAWVDWVIEKGRANQPADAILNGTTAGATTQTVTTTEHRNELRDKTAAE